MFVVRKNSRTLTFISEDKRKRGNSHITHNVKNLFYKWRPGEPLGLGCSLVGNPLFRVKYLRDDINPHAVPLVVSLPHRNFLGPYPQPGIETKVFHWPASAVGPSMSKTPACWLRVYQFNRGIVRKISFIVGRPTISDSCQSIVCGVLGSNGCATRRVCVNQRTLKHYSLFGTGNIRLQISVEMSRTKHSFLGENTRISATTVLHPRL